MASHRFADSAPSGYGATGARHTNQDDDFFRAKSGPGSFETISSQISQLIFKINTSSSELQRAQKKISTKDDNQQLRSKIHTTQQQAKERATEITGLLKQLHIVVGSTPDRQQKLQLERLTNSFKSTIERYDGIQKALANLLKTSSLQTGEEDFNEEQDTWSEEANLLEQRRRREQLQQQQQVIEDDLVITREREERIRQIESDILDVNDIFKELGAMVFEQGDVINDIEQNVTSAADNVEEGAVQLKKAESYQKSYRKKLCILAIIILVLGGVLALILGLTLNKKK